MDKETCDYYEPTTKNYTDKVCKYFNGNRDKKRDLERCRYHCSIIDCYRCMKERSYSRHKGALKQR